MMPCTPLINPCSLVDPCYVPSPKSANSLEMGIPVTGRPTYGTALTFSPTIRSCLLAASNHSAYCRMMEREVAQLLHFAKF